MYIAYSFILAGISSVYFWRMFSSKSGQDVESGGKYTILWFTNLAITAILSIFFGFGTVSVMAGESLNSILNNDTPSRIMFLILWIAILIALWWSSTDMDWFEYFWDGSTDIILWVVSGTLVFFSGMSFFINISLFKLLVRL